MPTYDYRCPACGDFEYEQSIKDDALTQCPTCGQQVKRLISNNVSIIFKGAGFYATDNRSSSYKKGEKAEAPSDSAGGEGKAVGSD